MNCLSGRLNSTGHVSMCYVNIPVAATHQPPCLPLTPPSREPICSCRRCFISAGHIGTSAGTGRSLRCSPSTRLWRVRQWRGSIEPTVANCFWEITDFGRHVAESLPAEVNESSLRALTVVSFQRRPNTSVSKR